MASANILGRGNKGSFSRFLLLVVGPLVGDAALGLKQVSGPGVKLLVRVIDYGSDTLRILL